MLSTGPDLETVNGKIEVFRIGYYGETDRKLVWKTDVEVGQNPVPMTAASLGAGWPPGEGIGTEGWASRCHTVDFIDHLTVSAT